MNEIDNLMDTTLSEESALSSTTHLTRWAENSVLPLALLDKNNNGFIMNAMHSREGCYTYIKEIVKGESYIELS